MALTIGDALKFGGLKKCKLLSGSGGLSNIILHANSMEVPDIEPWITPGELIITTGYALKNSSLTLVDLINIVHRTKASGIAIKTRYIGIISNEAIVLADKLNIPLIEMPDDLSFVDVITPLVKTIIDEHHSRLEYSQTIHDKFIDLEINGGGFKAISSVMFTLLNQPNAIVNVNFEIEASKSTDKRSLGDLNKFCTKLFYSKATINFKDKPITFYKDTDTNISYLIRKIVNKNSIYGYLILQEETKMKNEMSDIIIDHATTAIALEFSKKLAIKEQMKLMDNHFFLDILTGNIKSEDEAKLRAFSLNWPSLPLKLAIFDIDKFDKIIKDKEEFYIQELKESILNYINFHLKNLNKNCTIIPKSDSFTCLIPGNCKISDINTTLSKIQSELYDKLNVTTTVGISSSFKSYIEMKNANKDARDAIKISRLTNCSSEPIFIEYKRLEQAILETSENSSIRNYVNDTIAILEKYDNENNSELLETLNQLILCMGVKTKAAQNLFLHRNTLMYRIKKIEDLIGYDLSDKNQLLSLAIAIKFYPFIKNRN